LLVTRIQRFSLHDGPGIRTTFFFKGCPLRCAWCHNPETWRFCEESFYNKTECRSCKLCEALEFCPVDYKGTYGEAHTTASLVEIALKDQAFYTQSGGGITLSGGEVLAQPIDALEALVIALKKHGLHLALDTSGHGPRTHIQRLLPYIDTLLFDLKLLDSLKHRQFTGVDNTQILANLMWLIAHKPDHLKLHLRLPLIDGVNCSNTDLVTLVSWLGSHDRNHRIDQIDLLPYHKMGQQKGLQLEEAIELPDFESPASEILEHYKSTLSACHYAVTLGGLL